MQPDPDPGALEDALGHRFADRALLEEALTHPSLAVDTTRPVRHYQRLEFLGDAVVALAVSESLFRADPDAREGELSARRAAVCQGAALSAVGRRLGLERHLRVVAEDDEHRARLLERALGDAVEAVAGAVLLDAGFERAAACVRRWLEPDLEQARRTRALANPKGRLQELHQPAHGSGAVTYELVAATGPDHRRTFRARVLLCGRPLAEGEGPSRKAAEEAAARAALAQVGGA